ncbi:MAG: hypothetical protein K2L42_05790 [Clostridia bacterium]|nr:hypothetical protein [Clostridia bacterium]
MQNKQPVRRGFSFLSFFLGILIGAILIIGAIGGAVYFALSANVDTVLSVIGLDNGKNEEGKNQYINTDKENGGVETLLELIQKVGAMAADTSNLSMGEFENLLPATSGLIDGLHGALSDFVEVERGEFVAVKFSQLSEFMQEKILEVQPASLFEKLGMGTMLDNKIMELVFCGKEADYVINSQSGEKYPAYYDVYFADEEQQKLLRVDDNAELPEQYAANLVDKHGELRLYYYFVEETPYITDGSFAYTAPARSANGEVYELYNAEYARLSGNYYYEGNEKINVNPVTLRTLAEGDFSALNDVYLTELLESDDVLAQKVLGNVSLGDIMSGEVNFDEVLNNLLLTDIIDITATDKIMTRLFYGIANVTEANGETYAYTATYFADGNEIPCFIEVKENGAISRAYYLNGQNEVEISSLSVGDLQNGLDVGSLKISEIMDVNGNKILEMLADSTIDTLGSDIASLTVNEMYAADIYGTDTKKLATSSDFNDKYLYYYKDENGKYALVNGDGKLSSLPSDKPYYTYGEAQGMWKILLYNNKSEAAYTVNNLTDMIDNVSENMPSSTLYFLHDNGILVFNNRTDLDTNVNYNGKTKLGELELTEALSYLVAILNTASGTT